MRTSRTSLSTAQLVAAFNGHGPFDAVPPQPDGAAMRIAGVVVLEGAGELISLERHDWQ